MSKVVEVHLEWKYTPSNYLEQPIKISKPGIHLEISGGVAVAHIEPETFEKDSSISDDLTKLIENRLYAIQVLTHKIFSLSKPSRTDLREDGKRNVFLESHLVSKSIVSDVDLIITDKDGNVVSDTKQDRLDKQKWLSETIDRYRNTDITLDCILKSYQMSISDSNNEFVHLYEIRDALSSRFGNNQNDAIKALCLTKKQWSTIGILANEKPLEQGRHRGKSAGMLRSADSTELEEARRAMSNLIEKYLIYLEKTR